MYYDDYSVSSYHFYRLRSKEFEKMRKAKKKKAEIRKKKLAKEKELIKRRAEKLKKLQEIRLEKKVEKQQKLEQLKEVGYKPSWTKRNPLKRAKNSRNLDLCKEIYEKAKSGMSTYALAKEYDLHPNTILRHKYEYEYYLGIKTLDKDINI